MRKSRQIVLNLIVLILMVLNPLSSFSAQQFMHNPFQIPILPQRWMLLPENYGRVDLKRNQNFGSG